MFSAEVEWRVEAARTHHVKLSYNRFTGGVRRLWVDGQRQCSSGAGFPVPLVPLVIGTLPGWLRYHADAKPPYTLEVDGTPVPPLSAHGHGHGHGSPGKLGPASPSSSTASRPRISTWVFIPSAFPPSSVSTLQPVGPPSPTSASASDTGRSGDGSGVQPQQVRPEAVQSPRPRECVTGVTSPGSEPASRVPTSGSTVTCSSLGPLPLPLTVLPLAPAAQVNAPEDESYVAELDWSRMLVFVNGKEAETECRFCDDDEEEQVRASAAAAAAGGSGGSDGSGGKEGDEIDSGDSIDRRDSLDGEPPCDSIYDFRITRKGGRGFLPAFLRVVGRGSGGSGGSGNAEASLWVQLPDTGRRCRIPLSELVVEMS